MKFPLYQIDAFTDKLFGGNPAAVCPLEAWLPDEKLQKIGAENNLSETAFIVKEGSGYSIRWFTPTVEVDLCGHATLASAHVVFNYLDFNGDKIVFHSKSGPLPVKKEPDARLTLDFPNTKPFVVYAPPPKILKGLKIAGAVVYKGPYDYMVIVESQEEIERLNPDFRILAEVNSRGVVVTGPGNDTDFVSRCFYPQSGIDEDPVTGSAHCMMTPYWADRFGKNHLTAMQLSTRKGYLDCRLDGNRVFLTGAAVTYFTGEMNLE